jgi:hypothetical protein
MGRILARRLRLVAFDRVNHEFQQQNGDRVVKLTIEEVTDLVADLLQRLAAVHPELPTRELRARRISLLVDVISTSLARVPGRDERLTEFVRTGLRIMPGKSLTTQEIYNAYRAFAAQRRLPAYGRTPFNRILTSQIANVFSVNQSHDLLRQNHNLNKLTNRRGYVNMDLEDSVSNFNEKTDGTDGTDTLKTYLE